MSGYMKHYACSHGKKALTSLRTWNNEVTHKNTRKRVDIRDLHSNTSYYLHHLISHQKITCFIESDIITCFNNSSNRQISNDLEKNPTESFYVLISVCQINYDSNQHPTFHNHTAFRSECVGTTSGCGRAGGGSIPTGRWAAMLRSTPPPRPCTAAAILTFSPRGCCFLRWSPTCAADRR